MKVIKLQDIDLKQLIINLKRGQVIVYPTETCYGLGCDATNEQAVNKIFKIKKRQKNKPVLVLMPNIDLAKQYIIWNKQIQEMVDKYWPGDLTIVANLKPLAKLPDLVKAIDNSIAFRISSHSLAQEISQELQRPFVSTSANLSQKKDPYDIQELIEIYRQQSVQPDIIIDAGVLPFRSPSTIIKLINNQWQVLRQGEIKI